MQETKTARRTVIIGREDREVDSVGPGDHPPTFPNVGGKPPDRIGVPGETRSVNDGRRLGFPSSGI